MEDAWDQGLYPFGCSQEHILQVLEYRRMQETFVKEQVSKWMNEHILQLVKCVFKSGSVV